MILVRMPLQDFVALVEIELSSIRISLRGQTFDLFSRMSTTKKPRIRGLDWDYQVCNPTEVRCAKRDKTTPRHEILRLSHW
jgi:hypothetical protein